MPNVVSALDAYETGNVQPSDQTSPILDETNGKTYLLTVAGSSTDRSIAQHLLSFRIVSLQQRRAGKACLACLPA